MKVDGKNTWKFKLEKDVHFELNCLPSDTFYENDFLEIDLLLDTIAVKAGYAWDGCTPKFVFFDFIFGTPDGAVSTKTNKPKTYYASLIHDALYQFAPRDEFTRAYVDKLFLQKMAEENFKPRYLYYAAVRLLGWMWW